MKQFPPKVLEVFENLKKKYPPRLDLKLIKGRYYVYKERGMWLKEKGKNKTISEYLGKITEDGLFVKKKLSANGDFENAKAIIAEHGGKIIWEEKKEQDIMAEEQHLTATAIDLKILTALSMNARIPIPKLAKMVGLNEQTAYSRIKSLEEKLGIKYILEIDIEKLGYIQYLVLIKFEEASLTAEELKKVIGDNPRIQFAAITKGEYDVVMHIVDEDPLRAHDNLVKLRSKSPFKDYKAQWTLTYFAQISSFLPLRNRFLEDVLKERIWHRTEETPRIDKEQLRPREFMLLRELNDNSNINFTDIDEEYKLNKGTSRYTYQNLKNRGIIARPTISMSNLDIKYIGIIIVTNIYYKEIQENRYKYLFDIMEYGNIANKYSLSGNIGAPNGAIMLLPVMKEGYLDKVATNIEEELKGSIVKNLVVTDIVTGSLCYRRFDADYSRQYKLLLEFGKIKPKALAMYE